MRPIVRANRQARRSLQRQPQAKPKAAKITAPKLSLETDDLRYARDAAADNPKEEIKPPEKTTRRAAQAAQRPRSSPAQQKLAGMSAASRPKPKAALPVPATFSAKAMWQWLAAAASKAVAAAGRVGSWPRHQRRRHWRRGVGSDAPAGLARPLGGYQVRPRYPESARRAGVQGTTLLKLRVLENGRVGDVVVEQSAGHRDLDHAAADAVKKWLLRTGAHGQRSHCGLGAIAGEVRVATMSLSIQRAFSAIYLSRRQDGCGIGAALTPIQNKRSAIVRSPV